MCFHHSFSFFLGGIITPHQYTSQNKWWWYRYILENKRKWNKNISQSGAWIWMIVSKSKQIEEKYIECTLTGSNINGELLLTSSSSHLQSNSNWSLDFWWKLCLGTYLLTKLLRSSNQQNIDCLFVPYLLPILCLFPYNITRQILTSASDLDCT